MEYNHLDIVIKELNEFLSEENLDKLSSIEDVKSYCFSAYTSARNKVGNSLVLELTISNKREMIRSYIRKRFLLNYAA